MRNLNKNTNTVAGFPLGVLARAVLECFNDSQRVQNRVVRLDSPDIYYCSDTAVIVFEARGIKRVIHKSLLIFG